MELSEQEMTQMEKVLLGTASEKVDEEAPLVWAVMKPDNLLVKSLKDVAGLFAHTVKKEVETIEKNIQQAKKVYHGR
jgi:hypothetical protein